MKNVLCIMNILRETNEMVEIELMYNVKITISLCFMIWNDMIENDKMNT
jgi:hypothetical protein